MDQIDQKNRNKITEEFALQWNEYGTIKYIELIYAAPTEAMVSVYLSEFITFTASYGIAGNQDPIGRIDHFEPRTRIHRIYLKSLPPDSEIWLQFILDGVTTDKAFFRTPPDTGSVPIKRFAVVGDPHISVNRESYNGRLLEESSAIFHETLTNLQNDGMDQVFIPGDLTDYGKQQEYQTLAEELHAFSGKVHIVPGDHDLYFSPDEGPVGWQKYLADYPKWFFKEEEYAYIIGLDTSVNTDAGRFQEDQCNEVLSRLESADKAKPVIIITHYPLIDNSYLRDKNRSVSNPSDADKWLCQIENPCVIFAGHRNVFSIVKHQNKWQVSTPQAVQYPCGYLLGKLYTDRLTLQFVPIQSDVLYYHSRRECNDTKRRLLEPHYRRNPALQGYCDLTF